MRGACVELRLQRLVREPSRISRELPDRRRRRCRAESRRRVLPTATRSPAREPREPECRSANGIPQHVLADLILLGVDLTAREALIEDLHQVAASAAIDGPPAS